MENASSTPPLYLNDLKSLWNRLDTRQGILLYTEILSRILNLVKVCSKLIKLYIQLFISLSTIALF